MTSLPNQFPINEIRKLSRISMYTYALIVDVITAISSGPLNDIYGEWIVNLTCFLQAVIYIYSTWMVPNKSSSIIS